MQLRELLDLCQDRHSDDWVRVPGDRPATAMLAGVFDPGGEEPAMRTLAGHSIAVYEPDARLSFIWKVPDEPEAERPDRHGRFIPEWAEQDTHEWKNAKPGYVVILLSGVPVWQERVWYLDWGSGVGGLVSDIQPVFGGLEDEVPSTDGWQTTEWAAGLARLLNSFEATGDWYALDPTPRVVPELTPLHPIDAFRSGL